MSDEKPPTEIDKVIAEFLRFKSGPMDFIRANIKKAPFLRAVDDDKFYALLTVLHDDAALIDGDDVKKDKVRVSARQNDIARLSGLCTVLRDHDRFEHHLKSATALESSVDDELSEQRTRLLSETTRALLHEVYIHEQGTHLGF